MFESSWGSKNAEKEKKTPVENSGGHIVAVPSSFLIIFTCVCFACRTWYSSPNRQWGTEMVVGQTSTTT